MRKERFSKGRGSRSGGRSGSYRQGGRRGGHHQQRQSFDSGNQRERIAVESGSLVLIDQFMLANPDFIKRFGEVIDESTEVKNGLILEFGGQVVDLEPGTYRIERDPFRYSIIVHPEGEDPSELELPKKGKPGGHVFVDTRCLAMIDRELLDDSGLLEKYQQLWFSGQDKACRDLLRDNGGAVRYGFSRNSDELGVYTAPKDNIVCLWPDVEEGSPASDA